jgi:serine-type D-Ala-D-Ala carboxypeptidase/endopeptidase (penicillin-binding protein 4)
MSMPRHTSTQGGRPTALAAITGAALLAAACMPPPAAPAPRVPTLSQVVDSVLLTPPLHRTHWGVMVVDAASGRVLLDRQGARHFVPASNQKILVTAAALAELGPGFRFRTPVAALGLAGDSAAALLVTGRGDPTLSARFHGGEWGGLDSLADSIAARGIRRVGRVIADVAYFEGPGHHPSWQIGDLNWGYAAPIAAFQVNEGTFRVAVGAGPAPGSPAVVTALAPPGAVVLLNEVVTDTAVAAPALEIRRRPGSDTLLLAGRFPAGRAPDTLRYAVGDPAAFAAHALTDALRRRGVTVAAPPLVLADTAAVAAAFAAAAPALPPAPAPPLFTWSSPPLSEIVAAILKPSQNWIAESLHKTLGAERGPGGSWAGGVTVQRRFLHDVVGIDSAALAVRDASGLSAQNLVTPEALIRILDHARRRPWGESYRDAMAQPGRPGTLSGRLRHLEGRLHAKTGTIMHVNGLSGYVTAADGRLLLFSVLSNASGRPAAEVRAAIDRIVSEIAATGAQP